MHASGIQNHSIPVFKMVMLYNTLVLWVIVNKLHCKQGSMTLRTGALKLINMQVCCGLLWFYAAVDAYAIECNLVGRCEGFSLLQCGSTFQIYWWTNDVFYSKWHRIWSPSFVVCSEPNIHQRRHWTDGQVGKALKSFWWNNIFARWCIKFYPIMSAVSRLTIGRHFTNTANTSLLVGH